MLTGKMELGGEKPVPGPILHHNFHKDRTAIEFRLPRWEVEKQLPEPWQGPAFIKISYVFYRYSGLIQIRGTRLHANATLYYY